MTDNLPDYQDIEHGFKGASEVVEKLPESTERSRALHHLEIAEKYGYEARERAGNGDRAPMVAEMRGPAMLGWPRRVQITDCV